jgi:hypothetical protein
LDEASRLRRQLEKEGWMKCTVTDEPRLSELVELYEEIDLEVRVVPASPEDFEECSVCLEAEREKFKTIFTRPKSARTGG